MYVTLRLVELILSIIGFFLVLLQAKYLRNNRIASAIITVGMVMITLSVIVLIGNVREWFQWIYIIFWGIIVVLNLVEDSEVSKYE